METFTQILPQFKDVKFLAGCDCAQIRQAEQQSKSAWLLDEDESIWEFIEQLGEEDEKSDSPTPLNLYDFYVSYNIKFSNNVVALAKNSKILRGELKNFSELLNAVIQAGTGKFVVLIKADANAAKLKLTILQQFIYLRIYLPIAIVASFKNFAQPTTQAAGDVGIFGTKKAGKSALVNALLGDKYAVSSNVLPTPNKIVYFAAPDNDRKISLTYENEMRFFQNVETLQEFLKEKFSFANKNSATLNEMKIAVPKFPTFLNGARLIDTPGTNFAAVKTHADVTNKTLSEVSHAVFVMNYSQYLTRDELDLFDRVYKHFNNAKIQRLVLVAINRVDETFDSEETKSYERVADYIHYRLTALGYENFLVVSVSALQSVCFDSITKLIMPEPRTFFERVQNFFKRFFVKPVPLSEQLKTLKNTYRGTDKVAVIAFVNNIISDFEDFHGIMIENVSDLQKINRVNYLQCLIYNLTCDAF